MKNNDAINKGFPILNSECLSPKYSYTLSQEEIREMRDYIPYENIERYRDHIFDNYGQTIEELANRGGLSYKELYFAVQGRSFPLVSKINDKYAKPFVLNAILIDVNGGIDYKVDDNDSFDFFLRSYGISDVNRRDKVLLYFCIERLAGGKVGKPKAGDVIKLPNIFATSDCKEHIFQSIHSNIEIRKITSSKKSCNCCMCGDSEIYEIALGLNDARVVSSLCPSCLRALNKRITKALEKTK